MTRTPTQRHTQRCSERLPNALARALEWSGVESEWRPREEIRTTEVGDTVEHARTIELRDAGQAEKAAAIRTGYAVVVKYEDIPLKLYGIEQIEPGIWTGQILGMWFGHFLEPIPENDAGLERGQRITFELRHVFGYWGAKLS